MFLLPLFVAAWLSLFLVAILLKKSRGNVRVLLKSKLGYESSGKNSRAAILSDIRSLRGTNHVGTLLDDLVQRDGAGSWPPKATYCLTSWPAAL